MRNVLLAGGLLLADVVFAVMSLTQPDGGVRARPARRTRFVTAAALPTLIVSCAWLAKSAPGTGLECNGSRELCDRAYNRVVYAAAHNAMATSEDRFLGPAQDPSMTHQLDNGVRALLVDTHYWTPAGKVAGFLASLPAATRAALAPFARPVESTRPGTWLCHDICQLGATPLTGQLHEIRGWLDRNPDEVITLIVQNAISTTDTERAVRDSGLLPLVATPPEDPDGAWPTLRQLIVAQKRVFIFAEDGDVPGSWYRNFYRYGGDTPFRNESAEVLSCQADRGALDASLLLLNNWVTRAASSRRDAAVASSKSFPIEQARRCIKRRGRAPTYIAVDFASIGQLNEAVNALNGVP